MKVSKRQLRRIIKEEKRKLTEARLPAWERPGYVPDEDDPNDMGPSIEAAKKVVAHLLQIKTILNSPAAQHFGADSETAEKMADLADIRDHFQDFAYYLEND
jgi:hypothetical protein